MRVARVALSIETAMYVREGGDDAQLYGQLATVQSYFRCFNSIRPLIVVASSRCVSKGDRG